MVVDDGVGQLGGGQDDVRLATRPGHGFLVRVRARVRARVRVRARARARVRG